MEVMNNMAMNRHLVYLDSKQEDFLQEIVERKNLEALSSTSKLMRFIIEDYHKLITKGTSPEVRLNYISKEISMILNLMVSVFATLNVTQQTNENVLQYWQAQQEVERLINENKKRKGWKKRIPSPAMKAKLQEKVIDESYYDLFEDIHGKQNDGSQETKQKETQLKFEIPSFLKPFKEQEVNDDDYVEVTSDNWVDSNY